MDPSALRRLLPRDKHDLESARALASLGYPTVAPVLPQMLAWLKNDGSAVAAVMADFFVDLGVAAVPAVRDALGSRGAALKHFVVARIVARWPAHAMAQLRPQLEALATGSAEFGTDLLALRLLAEGRLCERAWLRQWAAFKRKRLGDLLRQAQEIEQMLGKS